MTAKQYIKKIFRDYSLFLGLLIAAYLIAWCYSFWAGRIDGERPMIIKAIAKFIIVTSILFLPSIIIFIHSLKRHIYSGGYIIAGLIFNYYVLVLYIYKQLKKKKKSLKKEK